jgi:hypothetical protein
MAQAHTTDPRDHALVMLYHELASEFTSLMTELGQSSRKLQTGSTNEGQNAIYSRFVSRLQDLQKRFAASITASSPPTKVDLMEATARDSRQRERSSSFP